MNKEISGTTRLVLCGLAIALNIVLGIVTAALKFPFYLDVMGTIFIAIYFGPWYGAVVGALTNILTSLFSGSFTGMPFMLVSIVVALIVGFVFRKVKFNFVTALVVWNHYRNCSAGCGDTDWDCSLWRTDRYDIWCGGNVLKTEWSRYFCGIIYTEVIQ